MSFKSLREFARQYDGVFTVSQAAECDVSRHSLRRHLAAGDCVRIVNGVYRLGDHPETAEVRIRVAVLANGGRAVLSGHAAAYWHGLADDAPSTIVVSVPRGTRRRTIPGVRVVFRNLADRDVIERRGLQVTGIPLSVLEAADAVGVEILDSALVRRRINVRQLDQVLERRKGTVRVGALETLVETVRPGMRSVGERGLAAVFTEGGVTGWVADYPLGGYIFDFAFVEERIAVEFDGYDHDRKPSRFYRNRRRRNAVVAMDWTPLYYTWKDILERRQEILDEVEAAREAARRRLAGRDGQAGGEAAGGEGAGGEGAGGPGPVAS